MNCFFHNLYLNVKVKYSLMIGSLDNKYGMLWWISCLQLKYTLLQIKHIKSKVQGEERTEIN